MRVASSTIFRRNRNHLTNFSRKIQREVGITRTTKAATGTTLEWTACVIRNNRDHVFGRYKSHYRDGTVPSARAVTLQFLSFAALSAGFVPSALGISTGRRCACIYRSPFLYISVVHTIRGFCTRNCARQRFVFLVRRAVLTIAFSLVARNSNLFLAATTLFHKGASRIERPVITNQDRKEIFVRGADSPTRCMWNSKATLTYAKISLSNYILLVYYHLWQQNEKREHYVRLVSVRIPMFDIKYSIICWELRFLQSNQTRPFDIAILTDIFLECFVKATVHRSAQDPRKVWVEPSHLPIPSLNRRKPRGEHTFCFRALYALEFRLEIGENICVRNSLQENFSPLVKGNTVLLSDGTQTDRIFIGTKHLKLAFEMYLFLLTQIVAGLSAMMYTNGSNAAHV